MTQRFLRTLWTPCFVAAISVAVASAAPHAEAPVATSNGYSNTPFSLPLFNVPLPSTEGAGTDSSQMELDSVLLRYQFKPGQEVRYRSLSYDSIMIFSRTNRLIVRERTEVVRYRCDSIVPDGYAMTMTVMSYIATERADTLPAVIRDTHPWVGRYISVVISPTGKRLRLIPSATPQAYGTAPGAPFQPLLLPELGPEHSFVGETRGMRTDPLLLENVYPTLQCSNTSIRATEARVDTLGQQTVRIAFSDAGNVVYSITHPDNQKVTTQTAVNAAGHYYFAPKEGRVVGGSYVTFGNITFETSTGQRATGRHIIGMEYWLMEEESK